MSTLSPAFASLSAEDPRSAQMAAPMSAHQKIAVIVTVCLCLLDGFHVFAITFAAAAIRTAWGIGQAQLGWVLASGLFGMAAGSLVISGVADLIGRRRVVFFSLILMSASSLWTAAAHNVTQLILSRIFTGLGIGTMIAILTSLAAEYSNTRSRDFCVTMMSLGFPLGGVLGGLLAAYLLPSYGWPALFIVAAALSLALMLVAWFYLPEPIAPMIARPRGDTLGRVNAYLARCGRLPIAALPAPPPGAGSAPMKTLFAPGLRGLTILITCIYFLHVVTLFFVQSWVPSLIATEGFAPARAALIASWVSIGGIVGGLLLGATSVRFGIKRLVTGAMACGAVLTAIFGSIPADFFLLALGSAGMGFFLQGAMMGLYAVVARTFPAHVRVSGTGLVIGIGRLGSAIGPALAGQLLGTGLTLGSVAIVMAVPSIAAALLLLRFRLLPPNTP